MGEYADDMIERMIWGPLPKRVRRSFQAGSGDFMWRTAEGELINMYNMTREHRLNAIEVCLRKGNSGKLKQLQQVQREMEKAKHQG